MLSKQIVDFSEEHFDSLPISPSPEILSKLPTDIPSFAANTVASRSLRVAWIQHTVSNTLCHRVFQPFLFSLGRRYDKADALFQTMSAELRNKSTRKEAVWRQHTLYAAYTASTAKKTTNAAAGAVVEEIVDLLRHLVDPRRLELVYAAVRRIVKTAAETWRYARLEREMITARMPAAGDEGEKVEDWGRHDYGSEFEGLPKVEPRGSCRALLRLLPIISREAVHESFRTEDEKNDRGCLYSHGIALYSDCAPVLARLHELQPSTTSPTPAPKVKPAPISVKPTKPANKLNPPTPKLNTPTFPHSPTTTSRPSRPTSRSPAGSQDRTNAKADDRKERSARASPPKEDDGGKTLQARTQTQKRSSSEFSTESRSEGESEGEDGGEQQRKSR